jgi:Tol biopolymer transport system component
MDADGSDVTRLTDHPAPDASPAWSPDGSKIAFTSKRDVDGEQFDGANLPPYDEADSDIFVMEVDGSRVVQLTDNDDDDVGPAWSPDGSRIAYTSYPLGSDLFIMNADGTSQERLTYTGGNYDPTWSPDGSRLLFTSGRTPDADLFVMNLDGTGRTQLTDGPAFDGDPAWFTGTR